MASFTATLHPFHAARRWANRRGTRAKTYLPHPSQATKGWQMEGRTGKPKEAATYNLSSTVQKNDTCHVKKCHKSTSPSTLSMLLAGGRIEEAQGPKLFCLTQVKHQKGGNG